MKNWKTTLSGLLIGTIPLIDALITAYKAGEFNEKSSFELAIATLIVVFGVVLKDPKSKEKKTER